MGRVVVELNRDTIVFEWIEKTEPRLKVLSYRPGGTGGGKSSSDDYDDYEEPRMSPLEFAVGIGGNLSIDKEMIERIDKNLRRIIFRIGTSFSIGARSLTLQDITDEERITLLPINDVIRIFDEETNQILWEREEEKEEEMTSEQKVVQKALGASSCMGFGPDGETVVIERPDGTTKEIKKITEDEAKNYKAIGTGKYFSIFYALTRGSNFYKGDFWKDVCAYSDYFGDDSRFFGGWTFYREKE